MSKAEIMETAKISIHAPREGSDYKPAYKTGKDGKFQSTLPVKGATAFIFILNAHERISIHAPREGSDGEGMSFFMPRQISIHAPREGSDQKYTAMNPEAIQFQSTLPVKGATS